MERGKITDFLQLYSFEKPHNCMGVQENCICKNVWLNLNSQTLTGAERENCSSNLHMFYAQLTIVQATASHSYACACVDKKKAALGQNNGDLSRTTSRLHVYLYCFKL